MSRQWPWAENRGDKLKRIAASYRAALLEMAPGTCHLMDARMAEFGEGWACGDSVDVDRLMTVSDIANEFGLSPVRMAYWARQHSDQIPARGDRAGKKLYRLGDIVRFQAFEGKSPNGG